MKGVPPAAADRGVPYGGAGAAATMQGYFQCATSPVGYATPASRRNWPPTSWRRALFCASTSARTPEPKPAQEFSPRANLGTTPTEPACGRGWHVFNSKTTDRTRNKQACETMHDPLHEPVGAGEEKL
ncbi:hypothetical protein V5799_033911 [Amblyomma americanum]|uniref:Uncharacterized protein n=1 Tax=Amblyomma americanum TaxID=6943 RepID=A0AAQ4DLZ0_AMBAM